jgi:2-polyprenyl-3-methyl-5-hydroxy-6-metoxy-1,4-benzoquinol methylase
VTGTVKTEQPEVEMISALRPTTFEDAEEWYDYASEDHFWFQWRLAAMLRFFQDLEVPLDRPARVLDVGCGTGVLRSQLEAVTPWVVDGADLNLGALRAAPPGRGATRYYDVEERRDEYLDVYDVVTCCDVIEHIDETHLFLDAVVRHLKPGGLLLVSVPALPGLYSAYDEAAGHVRRYTRRSLSAECDRLAVDALGARYWGLSMVPLLWLRKHWVRPDRGDASVIQKGIVPPGPLVHSVLRSVMRLETAILRRPVLGSSVLLAARRRAVRG